MDQPIPSSGIAQPEPTSARQRCVALPALSLRLRSMAFGIGAAALVVVLFAVGSRGFHWFDEALIGYAVATIFAAAAVTYKYTFWLARPQTNRYWRRGWQLFLSLANFRHYKGLIPAGIVTDLLTQQFIRQRSIYRWVTHLCIFWGVVLSCLITFPLTFGWLRFTQTAQGLYELWFFGFPLFPFVPNSAFGILIIYALDWTALLLVVGLVLAFHRRFHDLALIAVQRFRFDLVPLALLLAIAVTGLALTADSLWLSGAYYWFISLTHQAVVVLWLISLPFGKFFHLIERPATLGVDLYWRTAQDEEMAHCPRCGQAFAPARFLRDLKRTLSDTGQNYALRGAPAVAGEEAASRARATDNGRATRALWWQDLCPACKRVMRGQANLAALGRGGNQFL